jgi:Uma2 family endonuclease
LYTPGAGGLCSGVGGAVRLAFSRRVGCNATKKEDETMRAGQVDLERTYTAEEYMALDVDFPTELVRGRIVEMSLPYPRHGEICANVVSLVGPHVKANKLGRLVCNDAAVRTERGPDTVRGPDVAFWSYATVPPGPMPKGLQESVPEIAFEVRSPGDRWKQILAKVAEYLAAGVKLVCVLDPVSESLIAYQDEELHITMHNSDELHFPALLGELRVPVSRFFE